MKIDLSQAEFGDCNLLCILNPKTMKRKLLLLFSLIGLTATAQEYSSSSNLDYWKNRKPFPGYWQQDVAYKLKVTLSDSNDVLFGNEELIYTNNSPDTLNELYFHLYQNAFIKGAYLENLNLANDFKQKFGRHEIEGKGTLVKNLQIDGELVQIKLDNSILNVKLNKPLFPNQKIQISMYFETYFDDGGNQRRRMKLFKDNWGNKHYDGVHWYPRICVYDRKFGWETDQHLGKEFYGDFGSFDVELNFPHHFILDATGEIQNKYEALSEDLRKKLDISNFKQKPWETEPSVIINPDVNHKTFRRWHFKAINVHDFAWTADPTYRIGEEIAKVGNRQISIISLAQEPHASGWQDAASFTAKIIELYSRDIGEYIYPKMIVADARDGMEYPMLTLDGGRSPGYYGLLAHEVGHNWFFGMVGNNETYRASLDEGFTQFLTHWSTSKLLGEEPKVRSKSFWVRKHYKPLPLRESSVYNAYIVDAIQDDDMPLNTHSDDFNSALGHGGGYRMVYYKTATMLYNLQYVLGDSLFLVCMKNYFNQWKTCHPYFEDFRNSIIHSSKTDLNWFFDQWMETTKKIDYSLKLNYLGKNKSNNTYSYQIKLKRKGEMQMPIDLHGELSNGQKVSYYIPNTYFQKQTKSILLPIWKGWGLLNTSYSQTIETPNKIKSLQIDSTYRLADINALNNHGKVPIQFEFDHQIKNPANRKTYIVKWRPDLWYNALDGLKAGIHLNGNYFQRKYIFKLSTWYNTDIGALEQTNSPFTDNQANRNTLFDYSFGFKTLVHGTKHLVLESRLLDGLNLQKAGLEAQIGTIKSELFFKTMHRNQQTDAFYLHGDRSYLGNFVGNQALWNSKMNNFTLNASLSGWSALGSEGRLFTKLSVRTSLYGSDYHYQSISLELKAIRNLGKLFISSRLFGQLLQGEIAPESRLFLAGANPEEMMENKYSRSQGIIPGNLSEFGNQGGNFQMGGGLNVRGFNSYLMPWNSTIGNQYYNFSGNKGASFNLEIDYDAMFKVPAKGILKPFHLDAYFFADAGILGTEVKESERTIQASSDLRVSAGPGFLLSIKRWGVLDDINPLNIRIDLPLFLSPKPFTDSSNLQFRWLLGINRCF